MLRGIGGRGEGDDRGWDGWMASPTQWTWVWVDSGSWWWIGRPGVLRFMGLKRVGHDWATELNWLSGSTLALLVCFLGWPLPSGYINLPTLMAHSSILLFLWSSFVFCVHYRPSFSAEIQWWESLYSLKLLLLPLAESSHDLPSSFTEVIEPALWQCSPTFLSLLFTLQNHLSYFLVKIRIIQ